MTKSVDVKRFTMRLHVMQRIVHSSFITRRTVGEGRPLLPEILGQTDLVPSKTPIFNQFSLVEPQP